MLQCAFAAMAPWCPQGTHQSLMAAMVQARSEVTRTKISMASSHVLLNTERLALEAVTSGIPGDFVETGTNSGGNSIVLAAVALATCREHGPRLVHGFDSFTGLPAETAADVVHRDKVHTQFKGKLRVKGGQEATERNFERVLRPAFRGESFDAERKPWVLVPGYFNETLRHHPIEQIAVLRLDGDMYFSTMESLQMLYPRVSPGGFVIIDDYGTWSGCRAASHEYLEGLQGLNLTRLLQPVGEPARSVFFFQKPRASAARNAEGETRQRVSWRHVGGQPVVNVPVAHLPRGAFVACDIRVEACVAASSRADSSSRAGDSGADGTYTWLVSPHHSGTSRWGELMLLAAGEDLTDQYDTFFDTRTSPRVRYPCASVAIARSDSTNFVVLVRNPFERLLGSYLGFIAAPRRYGALPFTTSGGRFNATRGAFGLFAHELSNAVQRNGSTRMSEFAALHLLPVVHGCFGCTADAPLQPRLDAAGKLAANVRVLKLERQREWYADLMRELGLEKVATHTHWADRGGCFYAPAGSSCGSVLSAPREPTPISSASLRRGSLLCGGTRTLEPSQQCARLHQYYDAAIAAVVAKYARDDLVAFDYPAWAAAAGTLPW